MTKLPPNLRGALLYRLEVASEAHPELSLYQLIRRLAKHQVATDAELYKALAPYSREEA